MAENKNRVQAGRLLADANGVQVYELSTGVDTWAHPESWGQVTAAFNRFGVAVRVVRPSYIDGGAVEVTQVVLSPDDFAVLLASYRAYERAEKKRPAPAIPEDFDPFLDDPVDLS